ncbi:MAG TPA: hypothetical protein VGV93_14220, partial [Acidimicrobiales bacterium]|nr:hypothetical protein [Acidimicrobiales bacterium]
MTATGSTGASDITAPASGTEAFRALGFTFSVQTSDAALAGHIDQLLASLAPYRITLDTQEVAVAPSLGRVLDYLLWHINRQVLEHTDDALLVHAGAVAGRRGAVVLPAPSGSGKSTVVAGLVRSGMGYLTDEATAVDPATCTLHPYPKPLSLDQGDPAGAGRPRPPFSRCRGARGKREAPRRTHHGPGGLPRDGLRAGFRDRPLVHPRRSGP